MRLVPCLTHLRYLQLNTFFAGYHSDCSSQATLLAAATQLEHEGRRRLQQDPEKCGSRMKEGNIHGNDGEEALGNRDLFGSCEEKEVKQRWR